MKRNRNQKLLDRISACAEILRDLRKAKQGLLKQSLKQVGNRTDPAFVDMTDYELDLERDLAILQAARLLLFEEYKMTYLAGRS